MRPKETKGTSGHGGSPPLGHSVTLWSDAQDIIITYIWKKLLEKAFSGFLPTFDQKTEKFTQ